MVAPTTVPLTGSPNIKPTTNPDTSGREIVAQVPIEPKGNAVSHRI